MNTEAVYDCDFDLEEGRYIIDGIAVDPSMRSHKLGQIMLKKVIKPKLLAVFIAICTVGIIIVGYGFNIFQSLFI